MWRLSSKPVLVVRLAGCRLEFFKALHVTQHLTHVTNLVIYFKVGYSHSFFQALKFPCQFLLLISTTVLNNRAVPIIGSADQYWLILANFVVIGIGSNQHTY